MVEKHFGPGVLVEDIIKQSILRRPPPCPRSITLILDAASPVHTVPPPALPEDKTTGRFMRRQYLSVEQMKSKKLRATTVPRPSIGGKGGYTGRAVRRDDLGPPERHIVQEKLVVVLPQHTNTKSFNFFYQRNTEKPPVEQTLEEAMEPALEPLMEPELEPTVETVVQTVIELAVELMDTPSQPLLQPQAQLMEEPVVEPEVRRKTWASVLAQRLADENGLVIDDIPSSTTKVTIREVRRVLSKKSAV